MLRRKKSSKILGPLKISHKRKNCAIVKPLKWKDIIDIGPSIQTTLTCAHSLTSSFEDEKTLTLKQDTERERNKGCPEQKIEGDEGTEREGNLLLL